MRRALGLMLLLQSCVCGHMLHVGLDVDAGADAGEAEVGDAGSTDAGAPDASVADAGAADGGSADAGAIDGGQADAGPPDDAGAPDASVDAGAIPLDGGPLIGLCTPEGFCWATPLPIGAQWNGVFAVSETETWAVGEQGLAFHRLGEQWTLVPTGTTASLNAVYGFGSADVWAVGSNDTVLHWDGGAWGVVGNLPPGITRSFQSVFGATPGDVWVSGPAGTGSPTVLHFVDGGWRPPQFLIDGMTPALWGTGPDDVRVLEWNRGPWLWSGDGGAMVWEKNVPNSEVAQFGLWGASKDSWWAGYSDGYVAHFDGAAWSFVAQPGQLRALWGSGDDDLWGVGRAVDGGRWTNTTAVPGNALFHGDHASWTSATAPTTATLLALHGSSKHDVWAAGTGGALLHFDGGAWSRPVPVEALSSATVTALWASGPNDAWAALSDGTLEHFDGARWSPGGVGLVGQLSLSGTSPSNVWVMSNTQAKHFDGTSWTERSANLDGGFWGVWASPTGEAWAVTSWLNGSGIYRWTDDGGWAASTTWGITGGQGGSIWGSGPSDIYAGTDLGVRHFDGTAWSPVTSSASGWSDRAYVLWGSGPSDVYLDQFNGMIFHFDGSGWTKLGGPLFGLRSGGITGSGPNDVWFVDVSFNRAMHFDGTQWTAADLRSATLRPVVTTDAHHALFGGAGGQVLVKAH